VRKQVSADYILTTTSGWDSFSPAAATAIARTPGVESVSSVRNAPVRAGKSTPTVSGLDTATVPRFFHFTWVDGSDATLGRLGSNGAIVLEQFAKDHHLQVGQSFRVKTTDGKAATLVVRGIHKPAGLDSLLGSIAISNRVYGTLISHPRNTMAFVATKDGRVEGVPRLGAEPLPGRVADTESQFVTDSERVDRQHAEAAYVLLGLSVLVSLFGIVNTLVLSIVEADARARRAARRSA
jgi:hypothetical protein